MSPQTIPASMVDGLVMRPSGRWVDEKYYYLRYYLNIFSRGMKKKWRDLTYVDLFAGPGRCAIRGTSIEREGSPLIALGHNFSRYIFVESEQDCFDALVTRCKRSPKFPTIDFVKGDCNAVISKINPTGLSVAFVDPTGLDVHFGTIETLSRNRQIDLLINVSFGVDLKRNFERYRKPGSKLDLFLGGSVAWQHLSTPHDAIALYKERLGKLGYSTVDLKDIVVKNTQRNVPMYFLLLASKHSRGLDFWRKATSKDTTGQRAWF